MWSCCKSDDIVIHKNMKTDFENNIGKRCEVYITFKDKEGKTEVKTNYAGVICKEGIGFYLQRDDGGRSPLYEDESYAEARGIFTKYIIL